MPLPLLGELGDGRLASACAAIAEQHAVTTASISSRRETGVMAFSVVLFLIPGLNLDISTKCGQSDCFGLTRQTVSGLHWR